MQEDDGPLSDGKEDDPEIQPIIKVTRPLIKINNKDKPSLITHHRQVWPDTEEGAFASWRAATNKKELSDREELLELLQDLETNARALAVADGCRSESTLDNGEDGLVGLSAEIGTQFYFAYQLESQVQKVRNEIDHFETYNTDDGDLHRFYRAMIVAVQIAYDLRLLEIKVREISILRGGDDSYNHKGATTKVQMNGVKRVEQLMQGDNPLGKNKAVNQTAKEFHRSKSTILRWMDKHQK